jgi:hypothetical protein
VHNRALEEFEKAVQINEQLGIKIGPVYRDSQDLRPGWEFFIAALNAEKAVIYDRPTRIPMGNWGRSIPGAQFRERQSVFPMRCQGLQRRGE